jgi:hypothetical protein
MILNARCLRITSMIIAIATSRSTSTIELTTNAAWGIRSPRSALCLIFQLSLRAQRNRRRLNNLHLAIKVIEGVKIEGGLEVKPKRPTAAEHAA